MLGFPNWPMGFPTENDQHLGCVLGVPLFLETSIYIHIYIYYMLQNYD